MNFRGYRNIIANEWTNDVGSHAIFFSMQLNNEGKNDLNEYHKLIELCPEFKKHGGADDIVNILYTSHSKNKRLFFNLVPIPWGNELKNYMADESPEKYKQIETAALKVYTLLASITRSLMHNGSCINDQNIINVFLHMKNLMLKNGWSQQEALQFFYESTTKEVSFNKLAWTINNKIQKTMTHFFK